MSHPTTKKTVTELRHLTTPFQALRIATTRTFHANGGRGNYDGGMNFLGTLGPRGNTFPRGRPTGALVCSWTGDVSVPLRYDAYHYDKPNVLFDFDGSGRHFGNNDPRYFLPVGSRGITVNAVEIPEGELLSAWWNLNGGVGEWLNSNGWLADWMLGRAQSGLAALNRLCANGDVRLRVMPPEF